MKSKTEELLEALIEQIKHGTEFDQVQEQLKMRGIQSLLKAELSGHLGYAEGDKQHYVYIYGNNKTTLVNL